MASAEIEKLMHAEIDGTLDSRQRAELARQLLADPEARALHDSLRQLCGTLDRMPSAEAPPGLVASVLGALPQVGPRRSTVPTPALRWRFAAMIAGAIAVGVVVFAIVDGTGTQSTDTAGTMAAAPSRSVVQTMRLDEAPVAGNVSLYRAGTQLGLAFNLAPGEPVDLRVHGQDYDLRVNGLGRGTPAAPQLVELPGLKMTGQPVAVAFLVDGQEVASTTLVTPKGP